MSRDYIWLQSAATGCMRMKETGYRNTMYEPSLQKRVCQGEFKFWTSIHHERFSSVVLTEFNQLMAILKKFKIIAEPL